MAPYIVVELRGNVPIKPHARAKIDLSADSGVRPQLVMRSIFPLPHCDFLFLRPYQAFLRNYPTFSVDKRNISKGKSYYRIVRCFLDEIKIVFLTA